MAGPSPDNVVINAIGPLITAAIGAAIGWLPGGLTGAIGQPLTILLAGVGGISGLVFSLMYKRYLGVLDASKHPKDLSARAKAQAERNAYAERQAYDTLRESLRGGNIAARLYTEWLTKFLDDVDRFFGDAGIADRTLFPRAFGLETPAPLWTAPAFDRCLLLALIYPIVTIFIIWIVSGHVGPAEAALLLKSDIAGWQRGLIVGSITVSLFSLWRAIWTEGAKSIIWGGAGIVAILVSGDTVFVVAFPVYIAAIVASTFSFIGAIGAYGARVSSATRVVGVFLAFALALAFTLAFPLGRSLSATLAITAASTLYIALTLHFADARAFDVARTISTTGAVVIAGALALPVNAGLALGVAFHVDGASTGATTVAALFAIPAAVASFCGVVFALNNVAVQMRREGIFLSLYLLAMIIMCLGAVVWSPHSIVWRLNGPLLLIIGLLTLINAPFDWASLGLTRALLRRGLELGGWWPYFLALLDALAAAFIIALLAITMVIGVQTFDHLAEHSGGADARVLPLDKLFDGIAAQPSAAEYWWVYALLLSTMIPSLLNLMIGGASLLRGIPGLPALLLRFMPAGKAVPAFDRTWLALVLTSQVFAGFVLGITAQFVLAFGVIFYVLPWMGLELLDTARAVAEFDLPMRVLRLLWGDQP